jgi:hypothetical protein
MCKIYAPLFSWAAGMWHFFDSGSNIGLSSGFVESAEEADTPIYEASDSSTNRIFYVYL